MNAILTIAEAAERMSVSRQRMHQLIESYHLETSKVNGRIVVLHEGELKKIAAGKQKKSASKISTAIVKGMTTTATPTNVVEQVREIIERACADGDTVASIAKKANVTRQLVSRLKNGSYDSSPSIVHVQAILSAIGYDLQVAAKAT